MSASASASALRGRPFVSSATRSNWPELASVVREADLWGINLYPGDTSDDWIEFDSMINVRPSQGNPSRGVESEETQRLIRSIVAELVQP